MGDGDHAELSSLPPVHELASALEADGAPHALAVAAARQAIQEHRAVLRAGGQGDGPLAARAQELLEDLERPTLRRALNATGVIVHTNLGRAPLARAAQEAVARTAAGYCNLELDLRHGGRGSRQAHVEGLLRELTGAQAALVVGNGAGAVLLAVAALAGSRRGVVVSRGQLVEIGGGFRIPEVVAQSGARLIEVGTTNRTRVEDYGRALSSPEAEVGAILRVHPSNFRAVGFVADVPVEALCALGVPVIDDVGSGVLASGPLYRDEPDLRGSVAAGAAITCASADKLMGGPQAGLLVGRREAIAAAAAHPLARALRIDKLSLAALEATLRLYRDPELALREIPVLAMLGAGEEQLGRAAATLREAIGRERCELVRAVARVGGGAMPLLELEGPAVAVPGTDPEGLAAALRHGDPPVIARVQDGRLLLDPRTLGADELAVAGAAVASALAGR
ncbi:MAG: L-seryl-tRNA(Sec) selenium transferase [Actinomycetota bacterium]|nr:L-seryl-tRNA(Sec) selenium transferase [Actinomycetota bacterium]